MSSVLGKEIVAPLQDTPISFEQISINTAAGLTTIPSNANKAVITVETAGLRYRDDGTNPTSSVGHNMRVGSVIFLNGRNAVLNFKAIKSGTANSKINVDYYETK